MPHPWIKEKKKLTAVKIPEVRNLFSTKLIKDNMKAKPPTANIGKAKAKLCVEYSWGRKMTIATTCKTVNTTAIDNRIGLRFSDVCSIMLKLYNSYLLSAIKRILKSSHSLLLTEYCSRTHLVRDVINTWKNHQAIIVNTFINKEFLYEPTFNFIFWVGIISIHLKRPL